MKELFKRLWEKIKAFFLKVWTMIKTWATKRALPWLKTNWMQIINIIVLLIAYSKVYDIQVLPGIEALLGVWLFVLFAYYIFWKFFGLEKILKKNRLNPQPEPPKPIVNNSKLVQTVKSRRTVRK